MAYQLNLGKPLIGVISGENGTVEKLAQQVGDLGFYRLIISA